VTYLGRPFGSVAFFDGRSVVGWLFNGHQKKVEFDAVRLIDAALSSSELISDVRWAL
jgi:hypothetical protein